VAAGEVGSSQRPLVLLNVPFIETQRLSVGMERIARRMTDVTGLQYSTAVPTSYVAVVEALCAGQADAAFVPPLAYVLANDRCGAEMILASIVSGQITYRGQIITPADSPIRELSDLKGKRFAWTDPSSASGYLYPRALLAERGINPETDLTQQVFAGGHDKVVAAVLGGTVDAGATYEGIEDASGVLATFPDVKTRLRIVAKTADIPNDGVAVRKDLPPAIRQRLRDGLLRVSGGPDGKQLFKDTIGTDGVVATTDAAYDPVRKAAKVLGLDLEKELTKP
jgi:phosphonate transport system substrate-binding protein